MTAGSIDVFPLPRGSLPDRTGIVGGWTITSYFGPRPDPFTGRASGHGGMDLAAPQLTPLYAVKPGVVYQAWDPGGGGNWTRLQCDDGDMFGYGHAHHYAPGPSGRHVEAGEVIAYVGSTGASTGAHLHFAYQPKGRSGYGDPFDLLTNCRSFVGSTAQQPAQPANPAPEEDIMATKAELEQVVAAQADRIIAAIPKPVAVDDGRWMATFAAEGKVYAVINGVRYHIPGGATEEETNHRLQLLELQGFDNRGVQDAALSVLPEAPFSIVAA